MCQGPTVNSFHVILKQNLQFPGVRFKAYEVGIKVFFGEEGGNRPKTCGPGIVCAATDGMAEWLVGEAGVPLAVAFDTDLSLALDGGIGSH